MLRPFINELFLCLYGEPKDSFKCPDESIDTFIAEFDDYYSCCCKYAEPAPIALMVGISYLARKHLHCKPDLTINYNLLFRIVNIATSEVKE